MLMEESGQNIPGTFEFVHICQVVTLREILVVIDQFSLKERN